MEVVGVIIHSHACLKESNILKKGNSNKPKCENQPVGKALWPDSDLVIITDRSPVANTGYTAADATLVLVSGKALALLRWRLVLRTAYR